MNVRCAVCDKPFTAKRAAAKYCGDRCRQLAKRKRDVAATRAPAPKKAPAKKAKTTKSAETPAPRSGPRPKSNLVAVVRKELTTAKRLDTVAGQIALTYAIEATRTDATGVAGLLNGLREAMAEALKGVAAQTGPAVKDQVGEARRKRDAKKTRRQATR